MNLSIIKKLYFSPVKSVSLSYSKTLIIKKNIGIKNDRIFAFTRIIDKKNSEKYEKYKEKRNLNFFLTLKNCPNLNKYNFDLKGKNLFLSLKNTIIKKVSIDSKSDYRTITKELIERENLSKFKLRLIKNIDSPFFDTMPENSISLVNINSIKNFEKKISSKINHKKFRANIYVDNLYPWIEFKWIGKKILINNCLFKVYSKISRCSATNLKPGSNKSDMNLPLELKKTFGHLCMGIYLKPLNNGKINVNDKIELI